MSIHRVTETVRTLSPDFPRRVPVESYLDAASEGLIAPPPLDPEEEANSCWWVLDLPERDDYALHVEAAYGLDPIDLYAGDVEWDNYPVG